MSSTIKSVPPVLEAVPVLPEPDWSLAHASTGSYITRDQLAKENELLKTSLADAQLQIRARDAMLEGSHAQLVVQDLTLQKMHQALFNRENRTKNDRSLLFNGKAQVLSSDEFTTKIQVAHRRCKDKALKRAENAQKRESRKQVQSQIEEEWKVIKAEHEKAVEEHLAQCETLKNQGIPKKNWPKKPVQPLKPKVPALLQMAEGSGNDEDEAEGNGDNNFED